MGVAIGQVTLWVSVLVNRCQDTVGRGLAHPDRLCDPNEGDTLQVLENLRQAVPLVRLLRC